MHPLLDDPWVAAKVDAALAPYVGRLPPGDLAWMREQLAETLSGDSPGAELLARLKRRQVEASGVVSSEREPGNEKTGQEGSG